ncbi:hypothetical protein C0993_006314 [Termitomyces sp. T159_Od127]|nr:hypothetical protein C0993_006314 [Termitomyces sp. T159_Od127]
MVKFTILAGGFAQFVATYLFDSEAGSLNLVKENPTGKNPSWIASHPENSSILYAVNEVSPIGSLQSFVIDSEGGLSLVDTISTEGNGPTFANPLTSGEVTAMNVRVFHTIPTNSGDSLRFLRPAPVVNFPVGNGPSNPHMSLEHEGEVFVPDLGGDKIWRLVRDGAPGNFKIQGQINVDVGSGPRHIAIHGTTTIMLSHLHNILFIVSETVSTLTAMEIPPAPNGTALPLIANISTIPSNSLNAKFAAAEILISTPTSQFPDPLIYVSNRNLGPKFDPRGDTIAIFELKTTSRKTTTNYNSVNRKKDVETLSRGSSNSSLGFAAFSRCSGVYGSQADPEHEPWAGH